MKDTAEDRESPPAGAAGNWLAAVGLFGPLSLLAEVLMVRTHHRPLGAATFATAFVFMWVMAGFLGGEFDAQPNAIRARVRKITWAGGGLLSVIVICRGFL